MNTVFKALADPTRRKVLELLRKQPMTAGELADHFPVSRPTMSAHFAVLREADLIESTKIGTTITYQLKLSVLEDALLGFARLFGVGATVNAATGAAEPIMPEHTQKGPAE
jgi:DNA-binding transcriptional ArsR family regulator